MSWLGGRTGAVEIRTQAWNGQRSRQKLPLEAHNGMDGLVDMQSLVPVCRANLNGTASVRTMLAETVSAKYSMP